VIARPTERVARRFLLTAAWVAPIDRPPIAAGAVLVDDGVIGWVGQAADAPPIDQVEALGDVVLLPGLVNAHAHLELTVMRGLLEGLDFRAWIRTVTAAGAELTSDELLSSAIVGAREGLLHGITTFADTSPTGVPLDALHAVGARGIVYREVFGPDPARVGDALGALREQVELLRQRESHRVQVGVSPHAPYSVSKALFRETAAYAREAQLPIAIHIAESEAEQRLVRDGEGPWADALRARGIAIRPSARSSIALLADAEVLDARPLLIHCVRIDGADRQLIAEAGASVVHCPVSNAKLGHGVAPLDEMLTDGLRVGLGTDSVASNDQMDLLNEARTAVLMQRVRRGRPDTLAPREALRLATLGGAEALQLGAQVGSISVGKQADLAAFSLADERATPVAGVEDALVFALPGARAAHVWVAGERRVRHGMLMDASGDHQSVCRGAALRLASWRRREIET
jgi:cytosine/adenosine deaminase-related metal-dependent hydrolase